MDDIDYKILQELLIDGKKPIKQIAEKVNLSITPVHERIKKLEQANIITRYAALVQTNELNLKLLVFLQIKLKHHQEELFKELSAEITKIGEITEAYFTAGEFDVILKVILKDMDDYHDFIIKNISKLPMVENIRSSFVLRSLLDEKHSTHALRPINLKNLTSKLNT